MRSSKYIFSPCLFFNIFFLNGMADELHINTQKQDNIDSHNEENDVVSYTTHKNDKQFIATLAKKYRGLADEQKMNELLEQQNYIEVLNYLWTEPDASKRLRWLEKKVNDGHPILMLELGEEYYNQDPSLATYTTKTVPWILAGIRRTLMDTVCSSDESVSAAPEFLLDNYQTRILSNLQLKHSQKEIEKYLTDHSNDLQMNSINVLKKVLVPFVNQDQKSIPSPKWVFPHGLNSNETNALSESKCQELRKKEAQSFLKQVNEIEATLKKIKL